MSADSQPRPESLASSAWRQFDSELGNYLMRRVRHRQNAQDLAQEVYLRLMRVENQTEVRDRRAYMYKVAAHVVHEFRYRARERFMVPDSETVEQHDEEPRDFDTDPLGNTLNRSQQLDRVLGLLAPMPRAVLILYKRDGQSYQEIAQTLRLSEHTVKKYLCRALAFLRHDVEWNV